VRWQWILDFQLGIGNHVIAAIGFDRIPFFGSQDWVIPTIPGVNAWRHMGYAALLIFAGRCQRADQRPVRVGNRENDEDTTHWTEDQMASAVSIPDDRARRHDSRPDG
jgi:hypothetical protein